MKMNIKSTIDFFSKKPKTLFLLDGLGAAVTALSLFFVLRPFHDYFGMPENILSRLAAIGLAYGVYSLSCYFFLKRIRAAYIYGIAIANLLYCVLTINLLYIHYSSLTRIGMAYFLGEILIIVSLACLEIGVAKRQGSE